MHEGRDSITRNIYGGISMFEWYWYHWLFAVYLSMCVIIRLCKATGWRPRQGDESNGFWAASAVIMPATWVAIFYYAGFWN